ncbi:OsmC family protein [Pseudoalteromonas sp. MMG005]|uniref:OsmC family protein n=1 Tax=Pseudoalteromonas sp. MMG005 TaxID=2822682 RepID=UPI001B3A38CE|nr:OsmC family protein [Pseudoalteromonas sp. MMG005]MBQ4846734.1 OsmC family protein [Pseudoalteromonas sp. MMG005]
MSNYQAVIQWNKQSTELFVDRKYSRVHHWLFSSGTRIAASSSPSIVPVPYSNEAHIDPEEAFVAALSSCHMLFFLDLAAQRKLIIESYYDDALGTLGLNHLGKKAMTKVVLNPKVIWGAGVEVEHSLIESLHHQAHKLCFIANSVQTDVSINLA